MKIPILGLLLLAPLIGGCVAARRSAQHKCEEQQLMIWDAAGSSFLSEHARDGQLVDPEKLGSFFRNGKTPKCPAGTESYKPFNILEGPSCPNEPKAHALKEVPDRIEIIREAFTKAKR